MKHYILVHVLKPANSDYAGRQEWLSFVTDTREIELKAKDSQVLAENVWLLDRDNDVACLATIAHAASNVGLKYTTRFLTAD